MTSEPSTSSVAHPKPRSCGRLQPGDAIGESFTVESMIGSGGFARVYLGRQRSLGRAVALKVLDVFRNGESSAVSIERFMREARAAARIQHPNVVDVYDVGFLDDGSPYIAMELFQGRSLARLIEEEGPLPVHRALPMFRDCLGALAAAHAAGIVHRDIKPDNLIVERPGTRKETLKVIDFGVARLNDAEGQLTQRHAFVGTLPYLPAEYVVDGIVSPALDVYQMGLTLVEALTGHPLIEGENPLHTLHLITSRQLALPRELVMSPLGGVIARALAPLGERYPDAGAMLADLEAIRLSTPTAKVATSRPRADVEREAPVQLCRTGVRVPAPRGQRRALQAVLATLMTGSLALACAFVAYLTLGG